MPDKAFVCPALFNVMIYYIDKFLVNKDLSLIHLLVFAAFIALTFQFSQE